MGHFMTPSLVEGMKRVPSVDTRCPAPELEVSHSSQVLGGGLRGGLVSPSASPLLDCL